MDIPFSTIFMFLLAAGIALLTSLANRLLTDPKKSNVWKKEISEWNTELRKAQREKDKKRVEKLMKKYRSEEARLYELRQSKKKAKARARNKVARKMRKIWRRRVKGK
jgi:uncharacterized membrane protein (DUF106 family)